MGFRVVGLNDMGAFGPEEGLQLGNNPRISHSGFLDRVHRDLRFGKGRDESLVGH